MLSRLFGRIFKWAVLFRVDLSALNFVKIYFLEKIDFVVTLTVTITLLFWLY